MKRQLRIPLVLLAWIFLGSTGVFAQGSTSSKMAGSVTAAGEPLPGATVIAIHTPTGTKYGSTTNVGGLFSINNMNVGGPYKITATFVGYEESVKENIYLTLGQTLQVEFDLQEGSTELEEVIVSAKKSDIFDGNRTGAETFIGQQTINSLPTVERNLNDFMRLTPQANVQSDGGANGGISFSGMNNRFNAIFIDGAVNNDVFGLANSGTNGGQAGISPISVDALEQIQVVLAPYDVTLGGFAGGGVNAVTRSGTNEFEGSAYYFVRNESLSGKTPTDDPNRERTKLDPFSAKTFGARLGGPIIKNKLFFFANVEFLREEEPKPFSFAGYEGNATQEDINSLIGYLDSEYGYDPGGYLNNVQTRNSDKILFKIDWNINSKHKLTARHSYVKGETKVLQRPNSRNIYFENSGYNFPTTTNSSAIELKSNFNSTMSNNLILGATIVRDDREILGDPFPQIRLNDGPATIVVGTDNFSYSNIVFQDVFTLTNNFNLYKGKHTFTFGTHNEYFEIENLFSIFSTPRFEYFFNGINRFTEGGNVDLALFGHEQLAPGQSEIRLGDNAKNLGPVFRALQMAFYAQDEIQFTSNFKLTAGIRVDIPVYLDEIPTPNTDFANNSVPVIEEFYDLQGARAGVPPKTSLLWSPRVGFNWDVFDDNKTQIRGGTGVFTSRVPWVWPGGTYIRNGLNSSLFVGLGFLPGVDIPFQADPEEWKTNLLNTASPSGDVDLFVEDFKYPQIFRSSLALDQQLPWGLIGTVEFMFTKTLNNIDVKNANLKPSVDRLEGTPDNRPIFNSGDLIEPTYSFLALVDNTSKGYSLNTTVSLTKPFDNGFTGNIAYSFTRADALFDGQGFINASNWRNMHSVNGRNNPMIGRSIYDVASRVTSFLSYQFNYANSMATTVSLFYNGQSGQPFSYVYNDEGQLTNEDSEGTERNLIYVPVGQSEIILVDIQDDNGNVVASADQQWAALDNFIANDNYLSGRRGQYVERNMSRTPFEHILDFRVLQDFYITTTGGTKHSLQLSLDVFNFTNLLNKDWGRRYFVDNDNFELLSFAGFVEGTNRPTFTFEDPGVPWDIVETGINSARWSAQIGVRYSF